MQLVHRQREHLLQETVSEACRLIDACDDVRSVRIVGRRRPSYMEMRDYRQAAQDSHVRLAVDGAGVITLRPEAARDAGVPASPEDGGICQRPSTP